MKVKIEPIINGTLGKVGGDANDHISRNTERFAVLLK